MAETQWEVNPHRKVRRQLEDMAMGMYRSFWNLVRVTEDMFYLGGKLIRMWFLAFIGWSFFDLFGSHDLKQAVHDTARENPPIVKTAEELQIDEGQRRCNHLYQIRGLWNFFCPLCGKKLLEGKPPRWQI